jgi:hypothetical protein
VKPTVGFTLPWAGVTPAPSEKKSRNVEDNLSLWGSVLVRGVIQSEAKNPGSCLAPSGERPTRVPARRVRDLTLRIFDMRSVSIGHHARTPFNESELRGKHSVIS